jgi:hypothetical protein
VLLLILLAGGVFPFRLRRIGDGNHGLLIPGKRPVAKAD